MDDLKTAGPASVSAENIRHSEGACCKLDHGDQLQLIDHARPWEARAAVLLWGDLCVLGGVFPVLRHSQTSLL